MVPEPEGSLPRRGDEHAVDMEAESTEQGTHLEMGQLGQALGRPVGDGALDAAHAAHCRGSGVSWQRSRGARGRPDDRLRAGVTGRRYGPAASIFETGPIRIRYGDSLRSDLRSPVTRSMYSASSRKYCTA